MSQILSIVIPVYNEEKTITQILDRVKDVQLLNGIGKEILLINDASTDGSDEVINTYIKANPELKINYKVHEKNKGKGAALHSGINNASGEYIIILVKRSFTR